jgi:hypothetical protein
MQEDLYDTIETPAYQLCNVLCGQYEWTTEPWREKSRVLIHALMKYFEGCDPLFVDVLRGMYFDAVGTDTTRQEGELQ